MKTQTHIIRSIRNSEVIYFSQLKYHYETIRFSMVPSLPQWLILSLHLSLPVLALHSQYTAVSGWMSSCTHVLRNPRELKGQEHSKKEVKVNLQLLVNCEKKIDVPDSSLHYFKNHYYKVRLLQRIHCLVVFLAEVVQALLINVGLIQ